MSLCHRIRVYVDPEPERGPHPGYRGTVQLLAEGVHFDPKFGAEWLSVGLAVGDEWPESEWIPIETRTLVPWHRIHLIEFDAEARS